MLFYLYVNVIHSNQILFFLKSFDLYNKISHVETFYGTKQMFILYIRPFYS